MKKIRFFCLLLALVTCLSLFVSCKKDKDETPEDPEQTETVLNIVSAGLTDYVVVYDYRAEENVKKAIDGMIESIRLYTGATINKKECFSNRNDPSDVFTAHEVLIGNTNREETNNAMANLRSQDYVVGVYGEKLVLSGGDANGTIKAISYFLNEFVYKQGNRAAVSRGEGLDLTYSSAKNLCTLGTYSYTYFDMADARIDSYLIAHPFGGENELLYSEFATSVRDYISKQTGYELQISKDSSKWGDYEILIGDTIRTDKSLMDAIVDESEDYYIGLKKRQVTYEDGSVHDGAQLVIFFRENGKDAALRAFKSLIPTQKEPTSQNLSPFVKTSNPSLKNL